ncbi:MAG: hypothetical protein QM622_02780 [Microbacterium sp.]
MSGLSEHDPVTDADDAETEGSAASVWITIAFFVAFVVLGSSCIAINIF